MQSMPHWSTSSPTPLSHKLLLSHLLSWVGTLTGFLCSRHVSTRQAIFALARVFLYYCLSIPEQKERLLDDYHKRGFLIVFLRRFFSQRSHGRTWGNLKSGGFCFIWDHITPGGCTSRRFGWGCAGRFWKPLPYFRPKRDFHYTISDLTQNFIPYFRPDSNPIFFLDGLQIPNVNRNLSSLEKKNW